MQHFLYFLSLPHWHGSFRPIFMLGWGLLAFAYFLFLLYNTTMVTKRQKEVLDFITGYQKRKGYSPSLDEIRKKLKLSSVSTAHFHVSKLRDLGLLSKEEN